MKKYELLYIIPGKYTEEETGSIMTAVNELLIRHQAQDIKEKDLGKKKLTYPIKDNHYGYYVLSNFIIEGVNLAKIELALKLMPEIIRHQIVYYLEPSKTEAKTPNRSKAEEKSTDETPEAKPAAAETPSSPSQNGPAEKQPKVSLAELDKKLDELLKDDIEI